MAFRTSDVCPLGDQKKCTGKQQKNSNGSVKCECAFCATSKKRLLK